jgi:tetratricopeptide (TPR) repeat protein
MMMLLRAMGFWIWGLIAISLSMSVVTLSYRLASIYHWHRTSEFSSPTETKQVTTGAIPRQSVPPAPAKLQAGVVSRVIGKEIRAADSALQAGEWNEALRNLAAAQKVSPLTPFDLKAINEFKAYAYVKLKNLNDAQSAYEAELATGAVTVPETVNIFRMLFRLNVVNQQHAKAVEYGERLAERGGASAGELGILSQEYYLQKDCTRTAVWADRAITATREAGEAPKEILYLFKLQCASDSNSAATTEAVLTDLIRLTHKSTYWNTLLRLERQNEREDHNTLMLYRLMYDTASMTAGSDYIEMAQLLGDAALPAEAQGVLEKAINSGLILDQQKERTTRLLSSFKTRADADKHSYPQLDSEAAERPSGELGVKLGEIYYGFGEYQNSVTAINRGLQKGQINHLDDAYVYLGRADVALRDMDSARAVFANLKTVPNISPRVLKLWNLYAETIAQ